MFRIAVICGGPSLERGISLNSARSLLDHLPSSVSVHPLYVDQNCHFYSLSSSQLYSNTPSDFDFKLDQMTTKLDEKSLQEFFKNIDLAFPVIHGRYGEDGQVQEMLEKWKIPYVGSASKSCRKMFHKYKASQLLKEKGFETIPSALLSIDDVDHHQKISDFFLSHKLSRAIVKPVTGGSSIGVSSVTTPEDAVKKCQALFSKGVDKAVMLEPFCHGVEFTVVVFENHSGEPVALIPTEIEMNYDGHEIFDFRKKYLPTNSTCYHTPPRFDNAVVQNIRKKAESLFTLFEMRDFVRIDGWVMPDNSIYFTDFNPLSGLEQNSFLFRQASMVGMSHQYALQYLIQKSSKRSDKVFSWPKEKLQKDKKQVYVLFGGGNAERQVSLMSGTNVWLKLLQSDRYDPTPFLYDPQGGIWELPYSYTLNHTVEEVFANCSAAAAMDIQERNSSLALQVQERLKIPTQGIQNPQKMTLERFLEKAQKNEAFVFIAMHGGEGEDGTLQAYLEDAELAYNGSDSIVSAICMDKHLTGEIIEEAGELDILSLPKKFLPLDEIQDNMSFDIDGFWKGLCKELNCSQFIVKPRQDGCSAGVARLQSAQDLKVYAQIILNGSKTIPAFTFENQNGPIEMPLASNTEYFLEPYIETDTITIQKNQLFHTQKHGWVELTVGVLEEGGVYHSLNPSITIAEGSVLSLEEKFQGGTGVNLTPPPESIISSENTQKIKRLIERTARILGIANYARIDIFFNWVTGKMVVIEANTLPGLTPSTVIYHQALAEDPPLSPKAFLERIIDSALKPVMNV